MKRHPMHSICPYFAMFPESFVERQILSFSRLGDWVFDPFCGRGTTVFESLLHGRRAAGSDVNPVAVCIAAAKSAAPEFAKLLERLGELEARFSEDPLEFNAETEFFAKCFHPETYSQIMFLRRELQWRSNSIDCFIAAMALGALHGESHRSELYLSNRMPRTISTKPEYSIRWWKSRGLIAPRRNAFDVLRRLASYRYKAAPAKLQGIVRQSDARVSGESFPELLSSVGLVVTSPPYFDTTDYSEDQWLRLWFLGGETAPRLRLNRDDRHTSVAEYWEFLTQAWGGIRPLLASDATIVIRIGGKRFTKDDLRKGLVDGLSAAFPERRLRLLNDGMTSAIRPRDMRAFRPGPVMTSLEHDFVFRTQSA